MESTLRQGGTNPALRLIETMLWDGRSIAHIDLHLARLATGAKALGWPVPDVTTLLQADLATSPARVRLTCAADGRVQMTVSALPPALPAWRLALAATRLRSDDPWLCVKSTHRQTYDVTRAALPPGIDEAIFLNEKDEVCDGTITTLFFDAGDGLRTPPRRCGLLPGVLRASLLRSGSCAEGVLLAQELPNVQLWVGNALRGLAPAEWVGCAV